ncbi:hypothetical protein GCM10011491_31280 [Brucella endophytica]|uniref:Uncharacterized protein n=1 Tax=Brucella endophytica TaxID=1963359 RepID=A0A916SHS5_9HYPH|nr:hypothetical protein GCM10011491_31280 [Brucella endophytica]
MSHTDDDKACLSYIADILRELFKLVDQKKHFWVACTIGLAISAVEKALRKEGGNLKSTPTIRLVIDNTE